MLWRWLATLLLYPRTGIQLFSNRVLKCSLIPKPPNLLQPVCTYAKEVSQPNVLVVGMDSTLRRKRHTPLRRIQHRTHKVPRTQNSICQPLTITRQMQAQRQSKLKHPNPTPRLAFHTSYSYPPSSSFLNREQNSIGEDLDCSRARMSSARQWNLDSVVTS